MGFRLILSLVVCALTFSVAPRDAFAKMDTQAQLTLAGAMRLAGIAPDVIVAVLGGDCPRCRELYECQLALKMTGALDRWLEGRSTETVKNTITLAKLICAAGAKATDGMGVGPSLTGGAGVQLDARLEIVNMGGKVAIFCAPGLGVASNAGLGFAMNGIVSIGCKTPEDYKGQFVSLGVDVGMGPGKIAGAGASYSIGFDVRNFLGTVRRRQDVDPDFNRKLQVELKKIMDTAGDALEQGLRSHYGLPHTQAQVAEAHLHRRAVVRMLQSLLGAPEKTAGEPDVTVYPDFSWNRFQHPVKSDAEILSLVAKDLELPTISALLGDLSANMTGCDSISGHVGVGASGLPASAGVTLNHYVKVAEFDIDTLGKFASNGGVAVNELWGTLKVSEKASGPTCNRDILAKARAVESTLVQLAYVMDQGFVDAHCGSEAAKEFKGEGQDLSAVAYGPDLLK